MGATGSPTDLPIEICDEVEETTEVKKSLVGRQTRQNTRIQEKDFLCEFPPGESPSVAVTFKDYKTLEYNTWLNDIIIDFFLTWLYRKVLPEVDRARVHMFTTMFYRFALCDVHLFLNLNYLSRLITAPVKITLENIFEKDKSMSAKAKRHMRVRGWTKKIDLFSKDLVIFPICENNSHWYLVTAVRPKKADGFIFVLDSLGGGRKKALDNVIGYLEAEWDAKV